MKVFRVWFATLILGMCAVASGAGAQAAITDHVTPGGLSFRYAHLPDAQEQTIQFGWRDGFAFGRAKGQGLSSLGPNLILQGPKGMSRGEFAEDLKDFRARLSLVSSPSYTMGGVVAPHGKIADAIALFAKVLAEPALEPARLEELRQQYRASLRQQSSNASVLAHRTSAYLLHGDSPLLDWHAGSPAVYDDVSVEDIAAWRSAVFAREGLMISAAGRLPPDDIGEQIDKLFAGLPARGKDFKRGEFARAEVQKTAVLEKTAPQTQLLIIGWTGFKPDHELAAGQVAARVLRLRLFKAVREKLGASYGASAQLLSPVETPYILSLSAAVAHEKGVEALAAMRAEFAAMIDKGITADELSAEQSKLTSELQEAFRRPSSIASLLRNAQLTGRPADHVATALQRVAALSVETVNAAILANLKGKSFVTVVVTPQASGFTSDCAITQVEEAARCR